MSKNPVKPESGDARDATLDADAILARIDSMAASAREDALLTRAQAEAVREIADGGVVFPFSGGPAALAQAEMAGELHDAAERAAGIVEHAVAVAAEGAATAAANARRARAVAVGMEAEDIAETAAQTAFAVQFRADSFASMVAGAAVDAANAISVSVEADDVVAAAAAARVAEIVRATAQASAEETALAAAMVAVAVAAARAHAASAEASAAVAIELEVANAASAVGALASATAKQVSDETIAQAAGVVAAQEAAALEILDIGAAMDNVARLRNGRSAADLASRISEIARDLQSASAPEDLIQAIVDAALEHVPGAEYAGMTLVKRGQVTTPARSDDLVRQIDNLQNTTGQGPCIHAVQERQTVRVDDLAGDRRWPEFAAKAVEAGVRSMLSIQLFVQNDNLGRLNLYAHHPEAFTAEAEDIGVLLAAHGALAMVAVEREANLQTALASRDMIGQAKGIIMERQKVSPTAAFELLVRASQENNRKLTAIAEMVAGTGQEPTTENVRKL